MEHQNPTPNSDGRPLSTKELLSAIHTKFGVNFSESQPFLTFAHAAEEKAKAIWNTGQFLRNGSLLHKHENELVGYVDEIFGDSACALYLASCGLSVAARMLLRRSLELGLVIVAYWDSPITFWEWREHDRDIRFTELLAYLQSEGYKTFLNQVPRGSPIDIQPFLNDLPTLYSDLSNVVHPKPYNFSTAGGGAYEFDENEFQKTLKFADRTYQLILDLLTSRFPALSK